MNKKTKYILIAAIIIIVGLCVWFLGNIIAYILIALVLSLVLQPVTNLMSKIKIGRFIFPKILSAIITLSVFWFVVILIFRLMVPFIAAEANEISSVNPAKIVNSLNQPVQKISGILSNLNIYTGKENNLTEIMVNKVMGIVNFSDLSLLFSSLINTLGSLLIAFFAITFITFFFLKDDRLFIKIFIAFASVEYETAVKHAVLSIKKLLMRYFIGIIFDMLIIFVLTTIGMTILGLGFQHASVLGLIGGLFNIIPYVGPIISVLFGMLIGILTNTDANFYFEVLPLLCWMLFVYVIINILDATFVQPFIFSGSVKAHPLEIFLVILSAGTLAGVTGMILAIPSYTVLRVIAKEFFYNFKIVKKLTKNI
ncbi:MAG: AI-2E family transporter [Bacteroidetes bacterium CG23_combo_of_CG06-09_8_20_14_all_32_9]|nr:MAG: AI-2E family transporter [Bacteroidetes bacterium CG23_combo_of_CG06-09_8_20_14_all_32_9]